MSGLLIFFSFEFLSFDIVSYFDIRISNLFSATKNTDSIINRLIPKSPIPNPQSPIPYRAFIGLSIAILLLVLPACAPFRNIEKPEEDSRIVTLQQELDRIEKLNTTTRRKVEDMHNRLVALQAKIDSLEANLDELAGQPAPQSKVTVPPPKAPDARTPERKLGPPETRVEVKPVSRKWVPETKAKKAIISAKLSPERQYEKAYGAYAKHHFKEAIALFRKFLQRYPKHDLADNARYWIGETYYDMEDYPNAILAFKEVVTLYAERSKAPDALLKIGYSYVALDDPVNARNYFKRVISNYPFSEAEAKARAKLKELENLPYFPSTESP
jgi:tol-pal system protein YbgF